MAKPRRTQQPSKQSGGTFLGVVLGLIVGLAIAVAVALYITRTPTPFVAKVAPPASDSSASSTPFDPNRVLQGKTPGVPVPQAAQPASGGVTQGLLSEPQIVEVPGAASAPAASAPQNLGTENGLAVAPPLGNAQPAQPQTPAPAQAAAPKTAANAPAGANETNTGYFLQVGAYKTPADAEQQRARLAFQGFESKVSQRDAGGITYYRVRIGPFAKFEDMNSTRQRLSDAGIDTAVIRFTKQ